MAEEQDTPPPKQPDENDELKAGTIHKDPKANATAVAGKDVPRVLTVPQILQASATRAEESKGHKHCTTGNDYIDDITGGLQAGDTWLMGADTSWGKSSWAILVTHLNIKLNKRVLIVTSEDDEALYGDRLMCLRGDLDAKRYRNGRLTKDEWAIVRHTIAAAEPVPVYVDARPHKLEKLVEHLDKIIKQQAIDLVIFDYLQEFQSSGRHQDERVKYKELGGIMRRVVKTNKKCGIILSQLTMTEQTKIPTRRNIRETRDVCNAAETILIGFIPTEHIYKTDAKGDKTDEIQFHAGERVFLIDKCKKGPRGRMIVMPWDDRTASFKQVIDPEQRRIDALYDDLGDIAEDESEERYQ